MKDMKDATEQEWIEIQYLVNLRSRDGGGSVTDMIQKIYNTFISPAKLCRTCGSQIASVMSLIKLRYDLNKNYLEEKFKKMAEFIKDEDVPECRGCGKGFKRDRKSVKYCDECREKRA